MGAVPVAPWDVTAVIVTRGDCDLEPILASLIFDDVVIWNNEVAIDYGAYGRYVAIRDHAKREVVYVQDDDCVVSGADQLRLVNAYEPGILAAMMPPSGSTTGTRCSSAGGRSSIGSFRDCLRALAAGGAHDRLGKVQGRRCRLRVPDPDPVEAAGRIPHRFAPRARREPDVGVVPGLRSGERGVPQRRESDS